MRHNQSSLVVYCVFISVWLAGCVTPPQKEVKSISHALTPRAQFFSGERYMDMRLSPNGQWISFTKRTPSSEAIFVAPTKDLTSAISITHLLGKHVQQSMWGNQPNVLLLNTASNSDTEPQWHQLTLDQSSTWLVTTLTERSLPLTLLPSEISPQMDQPPSPKQAEKLSYLDAVLGKGHYQIISTSKDEDRWLLLIDDLNAPPRYSLFDEQNMKLSLITYRYPELIRQKVNPMMTFKTSNQDVRPNLSFFSAPKDKVLITEPHHFKPQAPLPTLVITQDSDTAQPSLGYSRVTQWLADRGYAVLQVANDSKLLTSTLGYAIEQQWVMPNKVAFIGDVSSSTELLNNRFQCGIRFSNQKAEELNALDIPLLRLHTQNKDIPAPPQNPKQENEQTLIAHGVFLTDETNQLSDNQRLLQRGIMEDFLANCLGGRSEPIHPEELVDVSFELRSGLSFLPFYAKALNDSPHADASTIAGD